MNFIKYPKVKTLGSKENVGIWAGKVYVEEKIDGANFRFGILDDVFRIGSRNVDLTNVNPKDYPKRFRPAIMYAMEIKDNLEPNMIYFAEATIPHSIQYDFSKMPPIIGFDIYDAVKCRFLNYDEKIKLFEKADIEVVPLVKVLNDMPTKDELENIIPMSKFYDGSAEGVVFKNYEAQIFAKLVSEKFKEVRKDVFGRTKKEMKDDTVKFVEYAFSPARIEKKIYELMDEGYTLDMRMMKSLIDRVVEDAFIEEGKTLFYKFGEVNFRRARKMLSRRTQNVLKMIIARNSLER